MKSTIKTFATATLLAVSSSLQALVIDFTDEDVWSGVNGKTTESAISNGIDVELSTGGYGTLTFNGNEGPGLLNLTNGGQLQGEGDGIGIKKIGDGDEINANDNNTETLTVTFDDIYVIEEIFILDLFKNEIAVFNINDDMDYTADPDNGNAKVAKWGFHEISVANVSGSMDISFWVDPPAPGDDGDNDYALAGLRLAIVSEPGTAALLAIGILGLYIRRKQIT